jgi:hypothetical protein
MAERRTKIRLAAGVVAGLGTAFLLTRLASRGTEPVVTYPPLDVLKPIADRVWIVDSGPIEAAGLKLPVRMTVISLPDGSLLLHSPTRYSPSLADELERLGPIRHLVAPSLAHWTFLKDWQRAFPDAVTWAAPGLRERRTVQRSGVRLDADLQDVPPEAWGGDLVLGVVPGGAGFSEIYLYHKPSGTLILTDLIENLEPSKLPAITALFMRATFATRGSTALHVRAVLQMHRKAARSAIAAIVDLGPARVVFAHGNWFAEEGTARLRAAFAWLLEEGSSPERTD